MKKLFTSESVGRGHPDKICDQISDAILDAYLTWDPHSKVAVETMVSGNNVFIAGEVKSKVTVDVIEIAKNVLRNIGYYSNNTSFITDIKSQSENIAMGVNLQDSDDLGAGDQGFMFGYATNETSQYMPLGITLCNKIVSRAGMLIKNQEFKDAKEDMKTQVTLDYSDPQNVKVDTIIFSCHHNEKYNETKFKNYIKTQILKPVLDEFNLELPERILINPTGKFVIGGPFSDTGLTGRKIIVDTYGGSARHGGGAFSGKDATKLDRSGAYMARWIAKNLVAANIADKIEVQIAYSIGVAKPVSVMVNTFGENKVPENVVLDAILNNFELTPKGIIKSLNLNKPIYQKSSVYGHFGREDFQFTWESLDKVEAIREFVISKGFNI
ncbi:methionine adenosyltransferase [Mycoplasmopsis synoviae]|uniref:S-adenosylmethionine synthase n=1 Tax=Mycoplasmopsis synoviae TaxID=2109 RepID=A0AAX3EZD7_MYCSY|nr:methionine adenosyltransferase [Mycoplasmopsis synoviae]UZW64387.1 methionine adenosyltransferase [Mycoplasmopsis synoviae]